MSTKLLTPEEAEKIMQTHAANLAEFFDSVVILTSRRDAGGFTLASESGRGDYFARYGLLIAAVKEKETSLNVTQVSLVEDDDDDF